MRHRLSLAALAVIGLGALLWWKVSSDPTQGSNDAAANGDVNVTSVESSARSSRNPSKEREKPSLDGAHQSRQTEMRGTSARSGRAQISHARSAIRKKGVTTIRRPALELDTSDIRRPIGARLKDQEISDDYAPYVDKAYAAYESNDYQLARRLALKILGELGNNVSMKRLVVASSCRLNDPQHGSAQQVRKTLSEHDKTEMNKFCAQAATP